MTFLGLEVGSWAEILGAFLSGIAIIMVVWQTKKTRDSEKDLFIYQNNIDKLSIVRNTISELRSSIIRNLFTDDNKDERSLYEIDKIIEQLENELSFINNKRVQILDISKEIRRLSLSTREIKFTKFSDDSISEEYLINTDKKIYIFNESMDILDSINKMIWEIQKELLK
ncbi:hypothetical protein [Vagococcus fluvialis]|uniref:hypothetical protein n=1 Tax=Vagococcus fluvialis TaxID=2738 RepID=UPI001A8D3064|nr:hypothetical protein [Vagococcus fluvialis]MBO0486316.1 hypothetical protein [Vagococcus fluvialis]MDT2747058.1 hypothetical protein [Vagococcus fluvialis]